MTMELRPILSAMMRNKLGPLLVAAQIAVTLAILVNGAFIVIDRAAKISRPTGMDVENIFRIKSNSISPQHDQLGQTQRDMEMIRAMPGVVAASSMNHIPLSGSGWGTGIRLQPGSDETSHSAGVYWMDEQGLETLGLKLIAGRNLTAADNMELRPDSTDLWPESVVLTQALADVLFPDTPALGKTVYMSDTEAARIVGIVEQMHGSWVGWDSLESNVLVPGQVLIGHTNYVIRTQPGQRDRLMAEVEAALAATGDSRILRRLDSLEEVSASTYASDRAVAVTLVVVIALLLIVTALGIVGLASFLVNQRTKQIGTRRALGAQKWQVVRYFLVENWLITTVGLSVGLVLAVALNVWMVHSFEMPRLDWIYLPVGLAVIWVLGIASSLGPARRASRVSPAIATRTV